MKLVDALSRASDVLVITESQLSMKLATYQMTDDNIKGIRYEITANGQSQLFEIHDNLLYRKFNDRIFFYVPKIFEMDTIRNHHEIGHVGVSKTVNSIRRSYWFPNMSEKVNDFIKGCLKCLVYQPKGRKEGYLHLFEKFDKPFQTIHIDHLRPLEASGKKNKYILVVIDGFTKFVKFYPTKTTNTREVINKLTTYFTQFSMPQRIVSDRGTCFRSIAFKSFLYHHDIKQVLNATQSPQSNGQVERMNSTLVPMISKMIDDTNKYWDMVLADCEFVFNNTLN